MAIADTPALRSQGFQGADRLPGSLDGMLFVFESPRTAWFHMRTVGFDLDIWWFDAEGQLIGSTNMTTCLDTTCVKYPSPGVVKWALETAAGAFDFETGARLGLPQEMEQPSTGGNS